MSPDQRARQSAVVRGAKREYHWTDEELLATLRQVAVARGRCSTITYAAAHSLGEVEPCMRTFEMRFGSWSKALIAAGLPSPAASRSYQRTPKTALWAAVVECGEETGGIPTVAQYERWARLSPDRPCVSTVRHRLGGWGEVIRVLAGH